MPLEMEIGGFPAVHLGLGSNAQDNLALRKRLGRPGAPFGGLGFFDPHALEPRPKVEAPPQGIGFSHASIQAAARAAAQAAMEEKRAMAPMELTKEKVRDIKLREFQRCARATASNSTEQGFYFWALQPIWDAKSSVATSAEILVRARNGADSAPFEDVQALMDPTAPPEVRQVFTEWKATEIVDWPLSMLKEHPQLCQLESISSNVRPSDLPLGGDLYTEVRRRLQNLDASDRAALLRHLVIEVVEDEEAPADLAQCLAAWRRLGFRLSYDDTIGDLACEALQKRGLNFHTTTALMPLLSHFGTVKVDIEWAGFALFLSHPAYAAREEVKEQVLKHAMDDDLVYVPSGPGLRNTHASYSGLLKEFARWSNEMIRLGKCICIELSVSPNDKSNAFALHKLKELGVDIFGTDKASFYCQGGPTGARAFTPKDLAGASKVGAPAG